MFADPKYSLSVDSELLDHYSREVIHHFSEKIQAVYDEKQNPLVFSATKESRSRLALTIADPITGKNKAYDLSKAFGIDRPVAGIAAFQDDSETIYLAFAVTFEWPTNEPNLYVVAPTRAADWRNLDNPPKLLRPVHKVLVTPDDVTFIPALMPELGSMDLATRF